MKHECWMMGRKPSPQIILDEYKGRWLLYLTDIWPEAPQRGDHREAIGVPIRYCPWCGTDLWSD